MGCINMGMATRTAGPSTVGPTWWYPRGKYINHGRKEFKTWEEILKLRKRVSKHAWKELHKYKASPVPVQRWSKKIAIKAKRKKQKKFRRRRK